MDIFTLARSTPVWSDFTRALMLESITRLTGTSTFIAVVRLVLRVDFGAATAGRRSRPRPGAIAPWSAFASLLALAPAALSCEKGVHDEAPHRGAARLPRPFRP